ncbi:TPA: hypothetical protein ACH3X2_008390 [Trebouxia sp. C0005]
MLQGSTQLIPGRIKAFLSHSVPGYDPAPEHEANIADINLSAQVPKPNVAAQKSMQVLGCSILYGCPVFKRQTVDHSDGNSWPVQKLISCKLAALPHHSGQHLAHQQQISVFHVTASIISSP